MNIREFHRRLTILREEAGVAEQRAESALGVVFSELNALSTEPLFGGQKERLDKALGYLRNHTVEFNALRTRVVEMKTLLTALEEAEEKSGLSWLNPEGEE